MSDLDRNYPTQPLEPDDDPRFTMGLLYDIRQVLLAHGYPPLEADDLARLQVSLFEFCYGTGRVS